MLFDWDTKVTGHIHRMLLLPLLS